MGFLTLRQAFLLLLGLAYIGAGLFIYVRKVMPISPWNEILSMAFIVYGGWRISRAFKNQQENHSQENEV